jgi:hypothetical protein
MGSVFTPHAVHVRRKNSFAKHKILNDNHYLEDTGVQPVDVTIEMGVTYGWTLSSATSISMLQGFLGVKTPMPLMIGTIVVGRGE